MILDKFNKIELSSDQLLDLIKKYISDSTEKKSTLNAREFALMYFYNYHKEVNEFYFIPENIRTYFDFLINESKLSNHTIRNYTSSLNLFCDYLAKCGVIDKNPVKRVKRVIKQDDVDLKYFTLEMLEDICSSHKTDLELNYRFYRDCMIPMLMIFNNINENDIINLKIKDISKEDRLFYLKIRDKKIKLDIQLIYLISNFINSRSSIEGEDYLFVTDSKKSRGKKLSLRNVREISKNFVIKCGFSGSPYRIITTTSLFYNYKKTPTKKLIREEYKIKSPKIIQRYIEEFPNFIGV